MIKSEFKHMGEHKLLIATICAIMIIPFLYSVFFLKSVWDPYGNSGSLPVAVVNEDQPVKYNGKKMQVGHDLIKKLKKNNDLEWHFVSASAAKHGISHKKYYMVITIPKNFSKNATTVLDKNPKKMQLKYKTNDSLNYIGKVISEQGVKQLNTQVRKSVSTAYAKTMFATIKKVGKGFGTAAKGAHKLKTGSNTLSDGINTYTAGVAKVNDGVIELQTGVVPLSSGVLKLTTGATTLSSGIKEYTAGVAKVNSGTQTLNSSTGTLASGVSQLATGSNSLASGLGTYTSGVGTLSSGLNQLSGKSSELNSGMQQLASSTSQLPTVAAGFYVTNTLINYYVQQLLSQENSIVQQLESTQTKLSQSKKSIEEFQYELSSMQNYLKLLSETINSLKENKEAIQNLPNEISSQVKQDMQTYVGNSQSNSETSLTPNLNGLADNSKTLGEIAAELETSDPSNAEKIAAIAKQNGDYAENISKATSTLGSNLTATLSDVQKSMEPLLSLASDENIKELSEADSALSKLMNDSNAFLKQSLSTTEEFDSKLTELKTELQSKDTQTKISNFKTLASTAQYASAQFYAKTFDKSINNLPTINPNNLTTTTEVTNKVNQLSSGSPLVSQISQLVSGVSAYTSGANEAATGANKLAANNSTLTSGASQLSSGLGTLNSNVPTLVSGVSQLASGTQTLTNNSSTLNNGAAELASGLSTLNNKVPTLTSGVSQLASGTKQLNDNSSQLTQGADKLASGNKALAVALKKGSKQVNSVQTSNKTANMFAAPSNLKHSNYSKVQNYGYALAPYMLSVALFVGSLVFNLVYPIRRMAAAGTGTEWFLSKVSVGALVATGNALIETLFMMACGLVPMHPVAMIVNALFFSYSAMFLIMFMSMLGNNPGRFVAMILLVIQLGACGGSFPIQITNGMNGFFQAINPYLPMTYSVLGFREALNSGLGGSQILTSIGVLSIFIVVCLFLLWLTMTTFVKKGIVSYDENIPDSNYPGN
ncbi:YhgE/Pip domain-containing protein [Liquorilactobacillus vini]|nr:YhgE/Pip domain-containing protein [Liquorilactobacillus vini]